MYPGTTYGRVPLMPDLTSLFIDLDVDENDKIGSKGNYEDIDKIYELDLPEIADGTGTRETVNYGRDMIDPGLEKMDRNAPTEFWYLAMDP